MAATALVDTSFLVALLSSSDRHHVWATREATRFVTPWRACESVLSETFHLLESNHGRGLAGLLRRGAVLASFDFAREQDRVLTLMDKYADLPMDLADACL